MPATARLDRAGVLTSALAALLVVCPPIASGQTLTRLGVIAGQADLVALGGSHAYIAAGRTLSIVNITDPSRPAARGRLDLPDRIWAMRVAPPLAFLALDLAGLAIVDVASPGAPVLRSVVKLPGQTVGVSSAGTRVLAANLMSGVEFIDASTPDEPKPLGAFFTDGYARDVAVAGSLAFVVDQPTGFSVLDVSIDGTPDTAVGVDQSAEAPLVVAGSDEPIAGRRVAVVANGRGTLLVYDVTDPAAPRKAATFKTPGRAIRVAVRGSALYVADGPAGLQVVSLADPDSPAITTTWPTEGPARDVAASEGLVIVVSGPPGQGIATILR